MSGRRLDASVTPSMWAFTDSHVVVELDDGSFAVRDWDYGMDVKELRAVSVYGPGTGSFETAEEAYAWLCGYEWGTEQNQ